MTKAKISVRWRRKPLVRFSPPPSGPLPPDWIDVGLRPTDSEPTYSDADLVQTIAEQRGLKLVALPPELAQRQYRQPCYMCGHAGEYLDWIVWNYPPSLHWSITDGVLMLEVRGGGTERQLQRARFVEIVGTTQPEKLPKELERRGVKLLDHVGHTWRDRLNDWNQNPKHRGYEIETWPVALMHRKDEMSGLARHIEKLFSRIRKDPREKATKTANVLLLDRPFETEMSDEEWAEKRRRRDAATRGFIAMRYAQRGHL
jgi:hypothetical protein